MEYFTRIHGSMHVRSMPMVHIARVGVHCPKRMPTQPIKLSWQKMARNHMKAAWSREGFIIRVKSATTASLGSPKDKMPGQNATMV